MQLVDVFFSYRYFPHVGLQTVRVYDTAWTPLHFSGFPQKSKSGASKGMDCIYIWTAILMVMVSSMVRSGKQHGVVLNVQRRKHKQNVLNSPDSFGSESFGTRDIHAQLVDCPIGLNEGGCVIVDN
jgi:hypothetical protein